jgi:hypothetical protein
MRLLPKPRTLIILGLICFAAIARFLPHPANFAPVAAVALFSGVYLDKRASLIVPLVAMMVSDYFIGFHNVILFTWGSMALVGLIGWLVRRKKNVWTVMGGSLLGSIIFFLITNAAVWFMGHGDFYPLNLSGLLLSYQYGLPFFRNTLLGDLTYVGVLFGAVELAFAVSRQLKARVSGNEV